MSLMKQTILAAFATCIGSVGVAQADPDAHADDPLFGIGITAGGGVTGFTDDQANDLVESGATWEVRGMFGLESTLALEAAYIGSAQEVDIPLTDMTVIGNGLEGLLRVNFNAAPVQPYVVGGAGWSHYSLRNDDMELDIQGDDDVFRVPVGVGLSLYSGPALVDVRAAYRLAFDDELIRDEGELESRESLDAWSATARVGLIF